MRRLVSAWEGAGRNVDEMLKANEEIGKELNPYICGQKGKLSWRAAPFPKGTGLRVMLFPEAPLSAIAMTRDGLIKDETRLMFLHLLLNPLRDKLCIRPCARCDRYFIKKRSNQYIYCKRRCARSASAETATRKRLKKEHEKKLTRARGLADQWTRVRTHESWKTWIQKADPTITTKWLTRVVNSGQLDSPSEGNGPV